MQLQLAILATSRAAVAIASVDVFMSGKKLKVQRVNQFMSKDQTGNK